MLGALLLIALACCDASAVFECERNAQCRTPETTGICEGNGYCSFGDHACSSGRRFDELAGAEVAGTCIGTGGAGCVFELAIGDASMCARRSDGSLACWGRNSDGQLSSELARPQLVPAAPIALARVAQVALGERHTCMRGPGDVVTCLGKNNAGQLGNDSTVDSADPVVPVGLGPVRDLDTHGEHSCAVANMDGAVHCWGRNLEGQLGDGSRANRHLPGRVLRSAESELVDASAVTTGRRFACALVSGRVECWGENVQGQLGDGTTATRDFVSEVDIAEIVQVVAGRDHACARDQAGAVWCWGQDAQGQVGDGAPGGVSPVPRRVALPAGASAIALGHNHSCALIEGEVWCWGKNSEGQIADPPAPAIARPVRVHGFPLSIALAAGFNDTCVIDEIGTIWCRGSDSEGQLATGQPSMVPVTAPVPIAGVCP